MSFKFIFVITGFLFFSTFAVGQSILNNHDTLNYPYHLWNKKVLTSCNTAKEASYLSQEEKNIVWLTNLARFDGALFSRTFLKEYIVKNGIKYTPYVKSLFKDLAKTHNLSLLIPDEKITKLAKGHAVWSGKRGSTGHQKFNSRAKKANNPRFLENAQYGSFQGLDIMMDLLIDEGISSLGHRKNILDPHAKYIGVSIWPHKKYKYNCVIDYAG